MRIANLLTTLILMSILLSMMAAEYDAASDPRLRTTDRSHAEGGDRTSMDCLAESETTVRCEGFDPETVESFDFSCTDSIGEDIDWDSCPDAVAEPSDDGIVIHGVSHLVTVTIEVDVGEEAPDSGTWHLDLATVDHSRSFLVSGRLMPPISLPFTLTLLPDGGSLESQSGRDGYFSAFAISGDAEYTTAHIAIEDSTWVFEVAPGSTWLGEIEHPFDPPLTPYTVIQESSNLNMPRKAFGVDCDSSEDNDRSIERIQLSDDCDWFVELVEPAEDGDVAGVIEYLLVGGVTQRRVSDHLTESQLLMGGFERDFHAIAPEPVDGAISEAETVWEHDHDQTDRHDDPIMIIPIDREPDQMGAPDGGEDFRDGGSYVAWNKDDWCLNVHKDHDFIGEFAAYLDNVPIVDWGAIPFFYLTDDDDEFRFRSYIPASQERGRDDYEDTPDDYDCRGDACLLIPIQKDWHITEEGKLELRMAIREESAPDPDFIRATMTITPKMVGSNLDRGQIDIQINVYDPDGDNQDSSLFGYDGVLQLDVKDPKVYGQDEEDDYFVQFTTERYNTIGSLTWTKIDDLASPDEECSFDWAKGSTAQSSSTFQGVLIRDIQDGGSSTTSITNSINIETFSFIQSSDNHDTLITVHLVHEQSFSSTPSLFDSNQISDLNDGESLSHPANPSQSVYGEGDEVMIGFHEMETILRHDGANFNSHWFISDEGTWTSELAIASSLCQESEIIIGGVGLSDLSLPFSM